MKRKKTRPPQPEAGEIRHLQRQVEQLPVPRNGTSFAGLLRAAEQARALYDMLGEMHRAYPWNEETTGLYGEIQRRYWDAIRAAYAHQSLDGVERLKQGDPTGLPGVLEFLELDPIFHGTGYLKEDLLRYIRHIELSAADTARLQKIVVSVVDRQGRRELREYSRLARKIDGPALRGELTQRLQSSDPDIRRRARWVLEALGQSS